MSFHWKVNGVEACQAKETLYKADGTPYDPPSACAYASREELEPLAARVRKEYPDAEVEIVEGYCAAGAREQDDFVEHCLDLEERTKEKFEESYGDEDENRSEDG